MATLNLVVLKARQTAKGDYPIFISVTQNRVVRYIKTEYSIDDLFQFDNGVVVCRKDAKVMNQRLKFVLDEYQEKLNLIEDHEIYNCSQIKEILEGKIKPGQIITVKEYFEQRIKELRKEGRGSYADIRNARDPFLRLSIMSTRAPEAFLYTAILISFFSGLNASPLRPVPFVFAAGTALTKFACACFLIMSTDLRKAALIAFLRSLLFRFRSLKNLLICSLSTLTCTDPVVTVSLIYRLRFYYGRLLYSVLIN